MFREKKSAEIAMEFEVSLAIQNLQEIIKMATSIDLIQVRILNIWLL